MFLRYFVFLLLILKCLRFYVIVSNRRSLVSKETRFLLKGIASLGCSPQTLRHAGVENGIFFAGF